MASENLGNMKDRIVLITGASRSLGRNMVLNLARRGVDLILSYRSNQDRDGIPHSRDPDVPLIVEEKATAGGA